MWMCEAARPARETNLLDPVNLVEKSMQWCWLAVLPSDWTQPAV